MPTVDDLVISLRIDDTSNLGKLQKQLTALVGPKGDKEIGIGVDAGLKRDMDIIKDRMMMLTHIAPGARKQPLIEQARAFFRQLRDPTMFENIMDKMGYTKDQLEDIVVAIGDIAEGTSPMKLSKISNFLKDVGVMITQSPDLIGEVKSLAAKLLKDIPEYIPQQRLQNIFEELGHSVRESGLFISKLPVEVKDILKNKTKEWVDGVVKDYEASGKSIQDLVEIIQTAEDPIRAFEKAFPGVDLTKLQHLSEKYYPFIAATIKASTEEQIGILRIVYEFIRDQIGQKKVIGQAFGRQQYDFLVKHWDEIRDTFEGAGLTPLGGKIKEIIKGTEAVEYEKIFDTKAVKEMKERIKILDHSILIIGDYNDNLPIYIRELENYAAEFGHTFEVWKADLRTMEKTVELAPTLNKIAERINAAVEKEQKAKEEQAEVIGNVDMAKEEFEELQKQSDRTKDALQKLEEFIPPSMMGKDTEELRKEEEKQFDELSKLLVGVDKTTKDTNKKLTEDINDPNVEKDPTED